MDEKLRNKLLEQRKEEAKVMKNYCFMEMKEAEKALNEASTWMKLYKFEKFVQYKNRWNYWQAILNNQYN